MADIVLINPRFEPSCWGLDDALPQHTITLIDENVTMSGELGRVNSF